MSAEIFKVISFSGFMIFLKIVLFSCFCAVLCMRLVKATGTERNFVT